jgi:hypothetical protein
MSQTDSAADPAAQPLHAPTSDGQILSAAPRLTAPSLRPSPLLRPARHITRKLAERPTAVQGTLALEWTLGGGIEAVPARGPELRIVSRDPAVDDVDPAVAVVATSRTSLPDPGPWTAQLVQAVLEVLAHERPRHQLARWLAPDVYADLGRHLTASPRRRPGPTPGRARRTVSSTHVFEPADGVVEATAVVVGGPRARAVALRLEGWDGRWRCTRLAIL